MEKKFLKKWYVPYVDQEMFSLSKALTVPDEDIPILEDPEGKRLEALSKALFSLAGPALLPSSSTRPYPSGPGMCLRILNLSFWRPADEAHTSGPIVLMG